MANIDLPTQQPCPNFVVLTIPKNNTIGSIKYIVYKVSTITQLK